MRNNETHSAMQRAQNLAHMRAVSNKFTEGADSAAILALLRREQMGVEQKRIPNRPRRQPKRVLVFLLRFLVRLPVLRGMFSLEASTRAIFYEDKSRRLP